MCPNIPNPESVPDDYEKLHSLETEVNICIWGTSLIHLECKLRPRGLLHNLNMKRSIRCVYKVAWVMIEVFYFKFLLIISNLRIVSVLGKILSTYPSPPKREENLFYLSVVDIQYYISFRCSDSTSLYFVLCSPQI